MGAEEREVEVLLCREWMEEGRGQLCFLFVRIRLTDLYLVSLGL